MESIKSIYRIGHGPSSSHTLGPRKAAETFIAKYPDAASYKATLYGSLAATGRGHLTDVTLKEAFKGRMLEIIWQPETFLPKHPNALRFEARNADGAVTAEWTAYSIGGGSIVDDTAERESPCVYPHSSMGDIILHCNANGMTLWQYVEENEGDDIWAFLAEIWKVMENAIKRGLKSEEVLPGGLNLRRKAPTYMTKAKHYRDAFRDRKSVV